MTFAELQERLGYLTKADQARVHSAYSLAEQLHQGQLRDSGLPYITHPTAVTALCAEWRLDPNALCAALLHDTLEDTGATLASLNAQFGAEVATLVDGLTKLGKLPDISREASQAESFRKMLLAMARDVRVILIKLADRTHNMRTLEFSPSTKWQRIARETQDIYAPLAHRLGLDRIYRELQDLSLRYLQPWRYRTIARALHKARDRAESLLSTGQGELEAAFARARLQVLLDGRIKSVASIYRKMHRKHVGFDQVNDIFGFRLIVPTLAECYTALGVLHQLYKPIPGKFKDYIALPKANGYQSLHTTLVGPSGVSIEFQVRTEPMHWVAESGVAAHWLYKSGSANTKTWHTLKKNSQDAQETSLGSDWAQSLLAIHHETKDAAEFWDHVRVDLLPNAVYVFDADNKILALPRGATVVDFAYAVHTDVGDHCVAARVNEEPRPLHTVLENGDRVQVLTSEAAIPSRNWLEFVNTGRARSRIRHHLKNLSAATAAHAGELLLRQALRHEGYAELPAPTNGIWTRFLPFSGSQTLADLFTDIGMGRRIGVVLAKKLAQLMSAAGEVPDPMLLTGGLLQDSQVLMIDGMQGTYLRMADCCHPLPEDTIVGYLGHGEGLVIHRENCAHAQRLLRKSAQRMARAQWTQEAGAGNPPRRYEVPISVITREAQGVLAQVSGAIAKADANILGIRMGPVVDTTQLGQTHPDEAFSTDVQFALSVRNTAHLNAILQALSRLSVVIRAQRIL